MTFKLQNNFFATIYSIQSQPIIRKVDEHNYECFYVTLSELEDFELIYDLIDPIKGKIDKTKFIEYGTK